MKRISAVLLAATMIVVSLPNQPIVKADEDDFPDEILFPINILDFPADNLFFEGPMAWGDGNTGMDYDSFLDLYKANIPGVNSGADGKGKNLVADHLESDPTSIYYRLPVYNEKTVDFIAKQVLTCLNDADNSALAYNNPYVDGKINPISMKNYIRKKDWKVLNAEDGELDNGAEIRGSNTCLKGKFVGNLGGPSKGSVTFKYNATFAGNHDVRIFQIANEARDLYITVNGGTPQKISCISTGSWDTPSQTPTTFSVPGFIVGNNTITISGSPSGDWAPDLDRIEIANKNGVAADDTLLATVEFEDNDKTLGGPGFWYNGNYYSSNTVMNDAAYSSSAGIGKYVWLYGWQEWSFQKKFGFSGNTGNYDIWIYYTKDNQNWTNYRFNGNTVGGKTLSQKDDPTTSPYIIENVKINKGYNNNTFSFTGDGTKLDKMEIHKHVDPKDDPYGYPLGTYAESKAKYNIDEDGDKISDYGWYDIETCYDYAYFITANLFKHHPSLNTAYGNYNNLVFHRVEQNGKYYYEFMADTLHNEKVPLDPYSKHYGGDGAYRNGYKKSIELMYENLKDEGSADEKEAELNKYAQVQKGIGRLIYNPETRSIRNACDASGNYVGPKAGEYETASGSMFVCDGDAYNTDMSSHYAGEGIKKYPTLDPPKKSEDLWGYDDLKHNFNYTIRTHSRFVYKEGADQKFFFSGDDDVYVFINGNLLVDLGGQHSQLDGSFNLDTLAEDPKYGLINGKAVDFDFFYIERHSKESNFWAKMSFKLKNDEVELQWPDEFDTLSDLSIPYGWVVDLNYKFSSMRELTTNKNVTFSDELGDIIGAKDFKLCDEVKLRPDKKLTVTVKRAQPDGTYVDEVKEFTFADQHDFTALEVEAVKQFFTDLSLEQDDSVELDGLQYDTSKKPFTYFDETEDAKIRQLHFETKAEYDAYMTMGGTNSIEDTVAIHSEIKDSVTVKVLIGALVVSTKIEGLGENFDIKKDLSAFGHFTISREETEDDSSTPDVDESIVYENQFEIAKGDNLIIFDAEEHTDLDSKLKPIYRDPLPKGTYKLKMDVDMLTGYTVAAEVRVNGETIAEISKGDLKLVKQTDTEREYTFDSIYIEINPKIEGGKWVYPEVEYILKAYREVNPLKDLT